MAESKDIQIRVRAVIYVESTMVADLCLCEVEGSRHFTLTIGQFEADAIWQIVGAVSYKRPMTHDLLKNVIDKFDSRVSKVRLLDGPDDVYRAELFLQAPDTAFLLDARPSDAVALALRYGCPIYITEDLLEKCWKEQQKQDFQTSEEALEKRLAVKGDLSGFNTGFLRAALRRCVDNEEYEKAVLLRNELERRG